MAAVTTDSPRYAQVRDLRNADETFGDPADPTRRRAARA